MKYLKLSEICNPKQWKTLSTEQLLDKGFPVYGANGKIGYYSTYNHELPTIMITCRGATCGSINISEPKSWINGNAMCLDNLSSDVSLKYLAFYLQNYNFNHVISGSAQPQITREGLEKVKVKVYAKELQEKISIQLDKVQKIISESKAILEKYDTLIKSRFIEMFGDNPIENGKWKVEKLKNICTVTSSKRIYAEEQSSDGVPFLRISDLVAKISGNDTCALYIPESKYQDFKLKGLVPKLGDILVTSRGTLGLCYIINPNDNFYFQDGMITWLSFENHNEILSIFLSYVFNIILKAKIDMETNGATVKYISISEMKQLKIPLPPLSLQTQFAAFVQQIDKSKFAVQKSLEKAETLYKSLMQEYFA